MCEKEHSEKEAKKDQKKDMRKRKKGDPLVKERQRDNRVNVAVVYFLEGVLLSANAKKNCSNFYMSMVDHLDVFNSYPWG